jgi:cytoskeleton protein RodZ
MPETIGQQLKQAREAKNLLIQKVVQATHIRAYQILAMEADDFESLPSPVQARAFIRLYAEFLGLSFDEMIAHQQISVGEVGIIPSTLALDSVDHSSPVLESDRHNTIGNTQTVDRKQNWLLAFLKGKIKPPKVSSLKMRLEDEGDKAASSQKKTEIPALSKLDFPIPATDLHPSQAFFANIGNILRQRRENLSLTLDEIERHTHVRKYYLQALETGEFGRLASSVQARGMLNNYAHFLNLDVDSILLTFADGLQAQRLEHQTESNESLQILGTKSPFKTSPFFILKLQGAIKRYFSIDIFVGGGLVIILLTFAIWGTNRVIKLRSGSTPQPTAPSILNILVSTPDVATSSPSTNTTQEGSSTLFPLAGETLALTLPATSHTPVQVIVVAQQQAWVRVTVDGEVQFQGRVDAGTVYSFEGSKQIEVLTGNGRAINILYNQNDLGPMGNFGEIVDHIYTANAILNPTATFTPTPTITQTLTNTLRPTITLRPSITPRPSVTPNR